MRPPLYRRARREIREYVASLKSIKSNARLYLMASMLMAVSMAIQNVLYNLYLVQIGYDEGFIGQVASALALGIALGGIPAGLLYDRFTGKITFPIATVGIVLSMTMRVMITSPIWLILWAGFNGLANSIYFVSIFPFLTAQSSPRERAHLYGANMAVWTSFMMIGSFIAGFLPRLWQSLLTLNSTIDSQRLGLLVGVIFGILAIVPFLLIKEDGLIQTATKRRFFPSSGSGGSIVRGIFVLFLVGMVIGLTTPFYNVYFKRIFEIDDALIGTLISLSQLMGLFSAFLLPFIVRRWGLIVGPALILGVNAPFIMLVGMPLPLVVISITFLFSAGMERLGEAPLMNLVMEVVQAEDRGAMSGFRLISSYGAQALAGLIGGWLVVNSGYQWLFGFAAAIQVIAASAVYFLFRTQRASLETTS